MPGGGKGPTSSGNITQTTTNPTQAAQLPFLTDLWNSTQQNARTNPFQYYPGQTLATNNPAMLQGYDQLFSTAQQNQNGLSPESSHALSSIYGTGQGAQANLAATASGNNPFMTNIGSVENGLNGNFNTGLTFAQGNTAPQARVSGITDQLGNLAVGGNPMVGQSGRTLGQEASGAYLNSNPYLDGMFGNAANQVSRAYQTTTAPQTDSNFEAAGRYGSGALANARSQNEQDLGQTLNGLASNIYGTNYANERGLQNSAAGTLGNLGLGYQGLQGSLLNSAGNLGLGNINSRIAGLNSSNSALGEQGGLYASELGAQNQAGLGLSNNMMQGLALSPSIMNSSYQPAQMMTAAGQGVTGLAQQQIQDQIARFQGNIAAPWQTLQGEANLFGQPTTGSNSINTPLLGPSPMSSALAGIGGLNSLSSSGLFGSGGLGGLFGGGGGLVAGAPGVLSGAGADALAASGLAADASGGTGLATLASAAPLAIAGAPLGTVICTELMRQGRMPKRHYLAAARADAKIPQIVRDGYHVWAIPSVRHLRQCPNSLYSRVLARTFNWRSEDLAARAGIKGARKLWRGRALTVALALPCLALGLVCGKRNWRSLYSAAAA